MNKNLTISIIQPDDWHLHLRDDQLLNAVVGHSSRIFKRCVVMPNLSKPITNLSMAKQYKSRIKLTTSTNKIEALIPCYLTDTLNLDDFLLGIKNHYFFGAKLYPVNVTTNSTYGVTNIENIFPALEILEKYNAPLLVHGEKVSSKIDIFDREKYFVDDELNKIIKRFQNLKIVLEHVSSAYGADFVAESSNYIASTITLHHLMLTKKDVFNGNVNPHYFCMPVVKNENDLICLRKYACSGNNKFFLGTDSAPPDLKDKEDINNIKPGIYTSPIAMEMYTSIFEEEGAIDNLEKFSSINGPNFYGLPYNKSKIVLKKEDWINPEFTVYQDIKIKNFMGGQKIKWQVVNT